QITTVLNEHSGIQDLGTRNTALVPSECLPTACQRQLDLQHRSRISRCLVIAEVGVNRGVVDRLFDDEVAIPYELAHSFARDVIGDRGQSGGDRGAIQVVDPQSAEPAVIRHARSAFSPPSPVALRRFTWILNSWLTSAPRAAEFQDQPAAIDTRTSPTPANSTCTRSPGAIGNCRVNEPLMMMSPARISRPNSRSLPASQITELSGLPSTASPRPVATVSSLIRTVAATASSAKSPGVTASPRITVFCCA